MHPAQQPKHTADFKKAEAYILHRLENELAGTLYYHGLHHTLDVMDAAMKIADAENISGQERNLLRVAVAYHDAGFIHVYREHEQRGCEMAKEDLPAFGFTEGEVEAICNMIMATRIPQSAINKLEQIICDADVDYLGRDDVRDIAQTLFEESRIYLNIPNEEKWNEVQIRFLTQHHYYTSYSIMYREPGKLKYLNSLYAKIANA
jgi:predicted metal-dependent HD superfamily phosphohydrolase